MTLFGIQQPPSIDDPGDIVKLPAIRARYGLISVPGVVHGPAVDRVRVAPRVSGNGDFHAFAYRQAAHVDSDCLRLAVVEPVVESEPNQFQIVSLFRIAFRPLLCGDDPHERDRFVGGQWYIYREHRGSP